MFTWLVQPQQYLLNCMIVKLNACEHFPELENTQKFVAMINDHLKWLL